MHDSLHSGAHKIAKKQDLHAEVITIGPKNVLSYTALFSQYGWKIGSLDVESIFEGDTSLRTLFRANVILLIYDCDNLFPYGYRQKPMVAVILEKIFAIGITATVIGVRFSSDASRESSSDAYDHGPYLPPVSPPRSPASFPATLFGQGINRKDLSSSNYNDFESQFDLILPSEDLLQSDAFKKLSLLVNMAMLKKLMAMDVGVLE